VRVVADTKNLSLLTRSLRIDVDKIESNLTYELPTSPRLQLI